MNLKIWKVDIGNGYICECDGEKSYHETKTALKSYLSGKVDDVLNGQE